MRKLGEDGCSESYVPQYYLGQVVLPKSVCVFVCVSVCVWGGVCTCVCLTNIPTLKDWWGKHEQLNLQINPDPSLTFQQSLSSWDKKCSLSSRISFVVELIRLVLIWGDRKIVREENRWTYTVAGSLRDIIQYEKYLHSLISHVEKSRVSKSWVNKINVVLSNQNTNIVQTSDT